MWIFNRRGKKVPPYHEQMQKADDDLITSEVQKVEAKETLEEAQSLQRELAVIRRDNHFARDFKKALGAKNGY